MPNGLHELSTLEGVLVSIAQTPPAVPYAVYRIDGPGYSIQLRFNTADGSIFDGAEQAAVDSLVDPVAHRERLFMGREAAASTARRKLVERGFYVKRTSDTADTFDLIAPVVPAEAGYGSAGPATGGETVQAGIGPGALVAYVAKLEDPDDPETGPDAREPAGATVFRRQVFTKDGQWTNPREGVWARFITTQAGAGGGGGSSLAAGTHRAGGTAGGAGGTFVEDRLIADLPDTVDVLVGTGGVGGIGAADGAGDGAPGGAPTGAGASGGGAGYEGTTTLVAAGGGGGGSTSPGESGGPPPGGTDGSLGGGNIARGAYGIANAGSGCETTSGLGGMPAESGGGAGGGTSTGYGTDGGTSIFGGGGGGGGGGIDAANNVRAPGVAGASQRAGNGGNGGAANDAGAGTKGADGKSPGGGGGGGGASTGGKAGDGGKGGDGQVEIIVWG